MNFWVFGTFKIEELGNTHVHVFESLNAINQVYLLSNNLLYYYCCTFAVSIKTSLLVAEFIKNNLISLLVFVDHLKCGLETLTNLYTITSSISLSIKKSIMWKSESLHLIPYENLLESDVGYLQQNLNFGISVCTNSQEWAITGI